MTAPALAKKEGLTVGCAYLLLALVWNYPLFLVGFSTTLPNDLGDPLLNTWILWWNSKALPLTESWWNAPAFYPTEGVLSFSETLLSIAIITNPLLWMGASPAGAYNVAFVLSFAASAMTAYVLCRECTGSRAAALVGGAYFGFGPHRAAHLAQIQIMWAWWIPLLFFALFRYRATARPAYLVLVAAAWIGMAMSSVYSLLFGSVGAALWGGWFLLNRHGLNRLAVLVAVGLASALVVMPILLPYAAWHEYYGFRRNIGEMESFSADVLSLLDGAHTLWTWPNVQSLDRPEGQLYPGVLTSMLLIAGAWRWWRHRAPALGSARLSIVLAAFGAVMIAVGVYSAWSGGVQWHGGPLTISVTTPYKPMGVGCVLLLAGVLLLPAVRESRRQGSVAGFWICCASAAYVFALGPTARVADYRFWYKAPYSWLMMFPGFDSARVPARFGTLLALALAVLVAFAVRRVAGPRPAVWVSASALAAVLADGATTISAVRLPETVQADTWGVDMVLEIPLETFRDAAAMSGSFTHGRQVVNGYSGFGPPHYAVLSSAIREGRVSVVDELRRLGTLAIVADAATDEGRTWLRLIAPFARPDLPAPWGREVFILPRLPERPPCLARALGPQSAGPIVAALSALDTAAHAEGLALAIDGNSTTFHTVSESTSVGEGFHIALNHEQMIGGLVLWMGPVPNDHPGLLQVAVRASTGIQTVFDGDVAGLAMSGALADPRRAPLAICFPPVTTDTLMISAPATTERPWNVAEVSVLGQ